MFKYNVTFAFMPFKDDVHIYGVYADDGAAAIIKAKRYLSKKEAAAYIYAKAKEASR